MRALIVLVTAASVLTGALPAAGALPTGHPPASDRALVAGFEPPPADAEPPADLEVPADSKRPVDSELRADLAHSDDPELLGDLALLEDPELLGDLALLQDPALQKDPAPMGDPAAPGDPAPLGDPALSAGPALPAAFGDEGYPVASWRMDERPGARTMADSTGNGLDGRVGREIRTGVRVDGATAYHFDRLPPDTPPTHPEHLAMVDDSHELDPGDRDFAITVRLRTTGKFGNIVQKGQAAARGGNFKMQIPSGIAQCHFRGSRTTVQVASRSRLNDGRWHTVRCVRTGSGLQMDVDGRTVARKSGWTGAIANSWPLTVGGKTGCDQHKVGCDYYAGDLDYIDVEAR
jgi:hypothetical protein